MLQASWQRSQRVARRRLAWRWLLWCLPRYVLPALVLFGVVAWLWHAIQPAAEPNPPALMLPSAATPADTAAIPPSTVDERDTSAVASEWTRFSPEVEELPVPLTLDLERSWNQASRPTATVTTDSTAAEAGTNDIHPPLKPENWLHSKEP